MPQFGLKMTVKRCRGEQSRWWGSAGNVDVMTYGNKNAYGIGRRSELFTHEDDGHKFDSYIGQGTLVFPVLQDCTTEFCLRG
jgi:hypothetical protein